MNVRFRKTSIWEYPFYRVESKEQPEVVLGWVEKDAFGDGWWSYTELPAPGVIGQLYGSRREAGEALSDAS